nr:hypothetical protein [Candidatus Baldrarchaeota archaeon]
MVGDPCENLVKEAIKKTRIFSLSKDIWGGALLYIQAAECYKASGDYKKAFGLAMEAVELLRKYAAKYGHDLVMGDLEKALLVAYSTATGKNKEKVKRELFYTMTLHAKQLEISGNYLGAADKYGKAIEFAPSGKEAKNMLTHAIQLLEQVAQRKALQRKNKFAEKLLAKVDELRMLLPTATELEEASYLSKKFSAKATFKHADSLPDVISRVNMNIDTAGLPVVNINRINRNGEAILKLEIAGGEISANIVLSESRILVDIQGPDPETVLEYFLTLKDLALSSVSRSKLIDEEMEGEVTPLMLLKLLNNIKDKCRVKYTYRELQISLLSIVKLIKSKKKLVSDLKGAIKEIEKIIKKIEKSLDKDKIISDEELPDLITSINASIEKIRNIM